MELPMSDTLTPTSKSSKKNNVVKHFMQTNKILKPGPTNQPYIPSLPALDISLSSDSNSKQETKLLDLDDMEFSVIN